MRFAGNQADALTPTSSFSSLALAGLCVGAGLVCLFVPTLEHATTYTIAALMFLCWSVPVWYHLAQNKLDPFESTHLIGLQYFTYFGLGAVWTVHDPVRVAYDRSIPELIPQAALYCLIGYVAWLAGYFGPWFRSEPRKRLDEMPVGGTFLLLVSLPGILGQMGAMSRRNVFESAYSSIITGASQLEPLFYFAWGLAWMLFFSGRATRSQKWLLFGLLVPATLWVVAFRVGNKSVSMMLAGVPIIALWYARRKFAWLPIVALMLVLVLFIFPFYNTFRGLNPLASHTDRASRTVDIITSWDSTQYAENTGVLFKRRMALINSVAVLIRDVPRWVPYQSGGELFYSGLAFLVPRVLWPDKPLFLQGQVFAHKFRIVNVMTDTHIATTVPGELYWTWDLPGIVFGLFLGGVVVRFLYRNFGYSSGGLQPVRRAVHILLLTHFVVYGGGLAGEIVHTFRTLLIVVAICWAGRRMGLIRPVAPATPNPAA